MRSHSLAPRAAQVIGLACLFTLGCGGGITLDVQVPKTATRADGNTPALIVAKATRGGTAVPDDYGATIKFSTDMGQFTPFGTATAGTPDNPSAQNTSVGFNSGVAKVQMYSVRSGTANVTCTYLDANGTTITKTVQVQFGAPGAPPHGIQYLGANPEAINLAGSGGVTTSQVSFMVTDAQGSPVADGVTVNFVLSQNPGGAAIIPPSATTENGTGIVSTVLSAGTIPGTVVITASTGQYSAQSNPIAISGRGVNYDDFSLVCDHYSIGGFEYFGLQNKCTVFAADVNGHFVPGTEVTLMTEAGGVPRHVPISKDETAGYGRGDFIYQTQCPLPVDVAPFDAATHPDPRFPFPAGEFRQTGVQFYDTCFMQNGVVRPQIETRTVNPRDGWATLVAYTIGEECYDDKNNNGQFDPGEEDPARCDLGEPFVDENDNNVWDGPGVDPNIPEGEPFFDYDGNGSWTPPNNKWDTRWPIWRKQIIVWTDGLDRIDQIPPAPTDPADHCAIDHVSFHYADINGNCPTATSASDIMKITCIGNCQSDGNWSIQTLSVPYAGTCNPGAAYDTQGLPYYTVTYADGHDCTTGCLPSPPAGSTVPACPSPGQYEVQIDVTRTLSTQGGGVGGNAQEANSFPAAAGTYN